MDKLIIVDGNAILHRAFHALPPLTTRTGEPINAVYGLVSMFLKVVDDLKPTHLVVCFDEKAPTFRHKAFKDYQSQRPPTAEDLSSQFEKARDFLRSANIAFYSKPGYEADDVIGTIAQQATKSAATPKHKLFDEVVIVTGDRDILQLVGGKVKLYMPIAGLSSAKLFGREETMERMGVSPELICDYKALVGDASDNYKGVAGIGPKTAISLLGEFGSFGNVYKNINKVPPKVREKLARDKKNALLSYKLATIVKNVPVKIDFDSMAGWKINSPEVLALFADFGFRTLTDRIKKTGRDQEKENQLKLL